MAQTITRNESQVTSTKPTIEFQHGAFNVQILPDSVNDNLAVNVNMIDSDFYDWHRIGCCGTITDAFETAVEWVSRGEFIEYKNSWIRVCQIPTSADGQQTMWVGDLISADLDLYKSWHDTDPEQCWKELFAIADRIDSEIDARIDGFYQ